MYLEPNQTSNIELFLQIKLIARENAPLQMSECALNTSLRSLQILHCDHLLSLKTFAAFKNIIDCKNILCVVINVFVFCKGTIFNRVLTFSRRIYT